jgi:anaerobic magnesium-protoporphyrin IX monomethyl ester cyclase
VKILFVYPNFNRQTTPQIGVSSLLSLIAPKHETLFFDLTTIPYGKEMSAYSEVFNSFKPDYVLISCRTNEWGFVKAIIDFSYPTPSIVGGIHPTVAPEEVIAHSKFIIRGEAEEALVELLEKLGKGQDVTAIPNVWVKHRGIIYRNEVRRLIANLDSLPMPLWEAWDKQHFYGSYIKNLFKDIECVGTFETSRGCPYACTYCCN